ncbi:MULTISPECIES: M48 family metallopeptidase [Legionella]|uniref:M48 family metallopeptidase n=1 Tax=Legionella TaxID=445 RepID=UPI000967962D|nr:MULTISPECIES: SprT family zinc-dependent metalloprotease [Legionella]MBN9228858.1 M48 family metallopeptidase [Legionella steelei]OJW07039.1 MAG: zinc metalloprotease [Legionella sp. 39-23]
MIIELDGIPIEISRKKIKNMNLRIYPPDGAVKVSVPLRFSEQLIRQSLASKSAWIHQQRERIRSRSVAEECTFATGTTVPFQGKKYLLIIEEHHGPAQIKLHDELMYCYTQPHSSPAQIQTIIERWYKQQMQILLPNLIQHWETIIGVKVADWGIRKMKTRWGSCNTKAARIWLNLNLAKKTPICLEYVLVHELIHLLEASHNKRFYELMSKFMPQWREYEYQLEGRML